MDYDQAVSKIKEAEASDTSEKSVKINLIDFDEKIPLKEYSYREVAAIVSFVEKVDLKQQAVMQKGAQGKQEAPAAVQSEEEPYVRMPEIAAEPEMEAQTAPAAQAVRQGPVQMPLKVDRTDMMKGIGAAAAEFKAAVGKVESNVEKIVEKKPAEKLVLPNLSISDQVNELEKISLGLDGSVFTPEQLQIIRAEVGGLARMTLKHRAPAESERQVVELRDKRLKEVLIKLGIK